MHQLQEVDLPVALGESFLAGSNRASNMITPMEH